MFPIKYQLDWAYGVEISKIKQDISELEKLGATHIEIEPCPNYDSASVSIDAFVERIETDEEFEDRLMQYNLKKEQERERELAQLKQLKAKYENDFKK